MSLYLNTLGNAQVAIGICSRCSYKRPIGDLVSDPNSPGLRVCKDTCVDVLDPWRLAPRAPDQITLRYPRPDVPINT